MKVISEKDLCLAGLLILGYWLVIATANHFLEKGGITFFLVLGIIMSAAAVGYLIKKYLIKKKKV